MALLNTPPSPKPRILTANGKSEAIISGPCWTKKPMGTEAASLELQETEMGNWRVVLSLEWTLVCLNLCPDKYNYVRSILRRTLDELFENKNSNPFI